jgi:two-component sensor histidine kinase
MRTGTTACQQKKEARRYRHSTKLAENKVLLHEVDHRTKNSLAIASSLLITQAYQQTDPAVRDLFLDTQERLNAMAHAHDLLSKSQDPRQVGFAPYLRDLCASLMMAAGQEGRIRIEVNAAEDIQILTNQAIVLGLLVNELVTNAIRHAFPPPMAGVIQVVVRQLPLGRVELQVRDDGVGMSVGREGSLGYGIIHSLVEQIDGEIKVGYEIGVAATVRFPV